MAEVLGWSRLTWRLTCSCFMFSRIRTHFKKSCFILMVNGNKISWFVGLLYTTTAELAEPAEPGTDGNAPISDVENVSPLQFAHLICIWIPFRNLFGHTHLYSFAKFEINFWNPLIGCQCFDFVYPKPRSVRPNWRTHSNFVRPESWSVRPACNDALWIQRWKL